jgi:hypothetical protein
MDPLSVSKYVERELSRLWSLETHDSYKLIPLLPENDIFDRIL